MWEVLIRTKHANGYQNWWGNWFLCCTFLPLFPPNLVLRWKGWSKWDPAPRGKIHWLTRGVGPIKEGMWVCWTYVALRVKPYPMCAAAGHPTKLTSSFFLSHLLSYSHSFCSKKEYHTPSFSFFNIRKNLKFHVRFFFILT